MNDAAAETATATLARQVAAFVVGLDYDSIPERVKERARIQILDAVGVGLASNAYPFAGRAMAGIQALGGEGDCPILGRAERLPFRDAALANGILIHGLDFDDTHIASIVHATAACLPAAMALGHHLNVHGRDFMVAYAAGMEVAIRIGASVKGGFHHAGFHGTGIVSHFSSAIVAGKLLGLTLEQMISAQGIAASTASGVQVFLEEGAWTKRFHPGWGAVAGITAAHLAKHGFVGPSRPYEGKFGLLQSHLQAHFADAEPALIADGLGERWDLVDTAIKPYPVCHFIHGAADAALLLREELPDLGAIRKIRIRLPAPTLPIVAEPVASKARPQTEYAAKFSAPYVVATCLQRGRFGLAELEPSAMTNSAVLDLCARSICEVDAETGYPTYFSGGVEVELADGRRLQRHIKVNSGAGERALDCAGASNKFLQAAQMHLSPGAAERACKAVLAIDSSDWRQTMAALATQ